MKAVVIYKAGGPQQLIYTEVPTPQVRPGWSLVKIKGFGINHSEIFTRKGLSPTVHFPRILGIECVGEIEQTTDPEHLPVGQRVISLMGEMGRNFDGSYAEKVLLPNDQIYPVNTKLPWETLATIPETYYTAYGSMLSLQVKPTDSILVRAATSGVGLAFLHLTKARFPHTQVAGSTRSQAKAQQLLDAGFDQVVIDNDGVLQTDQKFDKILELIGPSTVKDSFKHLNEYGIVCNTGQLGGVWYLPQFDPIFEIPENCYLGSFSSGNVTSDKLNQMLDYIAQYHVVVQPEKIFSLKDVAKAHEYLESRQSFGKVIVLN